MLHLFKDYESYLADLEDADLIYDVTKAFNVEKFIKKHDNSSHFFYSQFFESKAWITFLEEKILTETEEAAFQIQYFDEKLIKKSNDQFFKRK